MPNKKNAPKAKQKAGFTEVRAEVRRRLWSLLVFTFVPGALVYVLGILWIMGYDARYLWYAGSLGLVIIGYVGEWMLKVRWRDLISGYVNFAILVSLGIYVALAPGIADIVSFFAYLLLFLTVLYAMVLAGIGLGKWLTNKELPE